MQIKFDTAADALYIKLRKGRIARTKNNGDHLADYDKKGELIGFEILNISKVVPKVEDRTNISEVVVSKPAPELALN